MNYKRTQLSNGLRVITVPMPSFESVTVLVMVGAGSRYENKKNNGISHFLEHMAFKGTKNRPSALEISGLIDGIGGEFNAGTGREFTDYYIKTQSTHLELCIDLLSDMLQNLLLDKEEIEKEKGVIIEEINMYEDTPMRKLGDVYEHLLYGDTPMGWDVTGTKEVIRSITQEDFANYMKSLYSPDNMSIVIAGGIDEGKTLELVEKYFGQMPKNPIIKAEKVVETQKKPAFALKTKQTEQVHFGIGVRTVGLHHQDRYPLDVLAAVMGGGMSSRLFHEIREKRGLAYYVRTSSYNNVDCGTLISTAGVDPARAEEAVKVMMEEYRKIKDKKISDEEVRKAKEYMKGHFVLDLEDSRSVAELYSSQEILEGTIDNPDEILKKIDAVTPTQVREVAAKYLINETLNMAIIGNFKSGEQFEKHLSL
ncbi:MAG TPA: pitrilysin family protein [Patescibacteria group bacterium]|nr:pitrilysin family protein [Patescibacteria group bacterium]